MKFGGELRSWRGGGWFGVLVGSREREIERVKFSLEVAGFKYNY